MALAAVQPDKPDLRTPIDGETSGKLRQLIKQKLMDGTGVVLKAQFIDGDHRGQVGEVVIGRRNALQIQLGQERIHLLTRAKGIVVLTDDSIERLCGTMRERVRRAVETD